MATAKVIIKGEDQLKQPLQQASQELGSFGKAATSAGGMLQAALGAAAVAVVIKAVKEVAKAVAECVNEFKNQIEVETKLQAILKATGQQYTLSKHSIKEYASELQDITGIADDVVISTAAMLAASKKFDEQGLERTISLAADISYALGEDLPAAAKTLEKALLEPGEGLTRLKNIGITFTDEEEKMIKSLKDAGRELEAQQMILDKVEASYAGVAKSIGSIDTTTLDKIKNVWGDLKEDLGNIFTNVLGGVFDFIYGALRRLERLANQIAEKGNFNKYLANNNVQALADNFTRDYLQQQLDKLDYDKTLQSLREDWSSIWQDIWVDSETTMEEFIKWNRKDQIDYLRALYPDNYMKVDAFLGELNLLNEGLRILKAIQIQEEDQFRLEQINAAEAAAKAAAEEANEWQMIINDIFKKYDKVLNIESTEKEIKAIRNLMEDPRVSEDEYGSLEKVLFSLYEKQSKENATAFGKEFAKTALNSLSSTGFNGFFMDTWVGSSTGSAYLDIAKGLGTAGVWLTTTEAWMDIMYQWESDYDAFVRKYGEPNRESGLGFNFSVPFNGFDLPEIAEIDWTDTMSILGDKIDDLDIRGSVEGAMNTVLNAYGKYSEKYQEDLLASQIEYIESVLEKYVPEGSAVEVYFKEILDALKVQTEESKKLEATIIKKIGPITLTGAEEIETFNKGLNAVLNDFTSQTGEFGDFVSRLVSNMTQFTPILGLIITALHYIIQGFVEVFGDLLQEFAYYGLEPLREIGRVIADILMPMLEAFMPSIQQSASILIQIFDMIGIVLKPIAVLIGTVLGPVLKLITNFIEYILLPILKGVASIFLMITSTVEWFAECIRWVIDSIKSWFGGPRPKSVRSWADIYEGHMEEMWMGTDSESSSYGVSGTTNASYQGATTVYLNVYNNGTVVGENGIQEFAIMIRDELANVAYYRR